jgi:hypothetical protein
MDARTWWNGICSNSKFFAVASAIISLPVSSATTEISFSVYSHIHNKKRNRLTNTNTSKLLFILANTNNINFLNPDKSNNKITPSTSTSSSSLVSKNYVQSINKLATDKYLENIDENVKVDDSEDTKEDNYDTEDLVKSDNLSEEHNIISDDKFYEAHFK